MRDIGKRKLDWVFALVLVSGAACSDDDPPDGGAGKGGAGGMQTEAGAAGDAGSGGSLHAGGRASPSSGGRNGTGGKDGSGGTLSAGGTPSTGGISQGGEENPGGSSWDLGGAPGAGQAGGGASPSGGTPPIGSGGTLMIAGAGGANDGGVGGSSIEDPVILNSAELSNGLFGSAYRVALIAEGGTREKYKFSIASGSLPTGLRLSQRGVLNGVPQQEGPFDFEVAVTDTESTAKRSFHLEVERHRWACMRWADEYYGADVPPEEEYFREYLERVDVSNNFTRTRGSPCAFSPGGRWFTEGTGFRDAVGKTPGPLIAPNYPSCNRIWAPQERRFACLTGTNVDVIELSSTPTVVPHAITGCTAGNWSTSGKRLAATCAGTLRVVTAGSDQIQNVGAATWSGWVGDDLLLFRNGTGALMSVNLSQSPLAPQVRLQNTTGLGTKFRAEVATQRVLFFDGTGALATVFLDLSTGYTNSNHQAANYSHHLDYYFYNTIDDLNMGRVEVYSTALPTSAPPVVNLPTVQLSPAFWSDKGTVLVTKPLNDRTRFTDFEESVRSREVAGTFQIQGWGEEARWLLGYGADKAFIINLVPATPARAELWSDDGGVTSISPSGTAVRTPQWGNGAHGEDYPCVVKVSDSGPGSPTCSPRTSDPALDFELWPFKWSSDSSAVFFGTLGEAVGPDDYAAGLSALIAGGQNFDLLRGFHGLAIHQYAMSVQVQP